MTDYEPVSSPDDWRAVNHALFMMNPEQRLQVYPNGKELLSRLRAEGYELVRERESSERNG